MSASALSVRARLGSAISATVSEIGNSIRQRVSSRRRRVPTQRELRAECETLENRRLLNAVVPGSFGSNGFVVYVSYSYQAWQQGPCCEKSHLVQTTINAAFEYIPGADGPILPLSFSSSRVEDSSTASAYPVRYADGQPIVSDTDISSAGFGQSWGQTRTWADPAGGSGNGTYVNGNRWTVSQMPQVIQDPLGSGDLVVIDDGNNQRWFSPSGTSTNQYTETAPPFNTLRIDGATSEYVVTDNTGSQEWFYNLNSTDPTKPAGQIAEYVDPMGHATNYTYQNGQLTETRRTSGLAVEGWHYFYLGTGDPNQGKLSTVVLRRSSDGGNTWTDVQEEDYAYYTKSSNWGPTDFGSVGDLQSVTTRAGAANDNQPGTGAVIGTEVYRYYTPYDAGTIGYAGGLRYIFEPDADARAKAAGYDPATSTNDSQLQMYASNYFEYDNYKNPGSDHTVVKEIAHGGGCSCSSDGGQGIYLYSYQANPNYAGDGYDNWKMRTTVTLPDQNQEIVYTNYAGQPLLDIQKEVSTGKQWLRADHYDTTTGNLLWEAQPSAVTGYSESYPDLVNYNPATGAATYVSTNSGLVDLIDYYSVGWTVSGAAGVASNNSAISGALSAHDGQQAAFLQDNTGLISQSVNASGGANYTLNFWAAYASGTAPAVQVLLDGSPVGTAITPGTSYAQYSVLLSGLSAGAHTIAFQKTGTGTGTALIDAVSLSGTGAPALSDPSFESPTLAAGTYVYDPLGSTATATAAAGVTGLLQDKKVEQGLSAGPANIQETEQFGYIAQGGGTSGQSGASGLTYLPGTDTLFGQTGGGDPRVTTDSYTFYPGTTQVQQQTVIMPPIVAGQNGPATSTTDTADADASVIYYDAYGREQWTKDGDGHVNYIGYLDNTSGLDTGTGAVTKTITDVDYNKLTATEQGLFPSSWAHPTGGLHLVTQMTVDGLGRTKQIVRDPGQADAQTTWILYNDPNHETRTYPGWHQIPNTSTYTTTGAMQVQREYFPAPNAPAGQQTLYDETLTVTAPVESTSTPSGTENIDQTNIQSLSRQLTNGGGQVTEQDDYFSLAGVTYSQAAAQLGTASNNSAGGNYHATLDGYDDRGRQDRVQMPTGTIYRTVYDDLGNPVSRWVGTDDTPTSGEWSPTNNASPCNMVDVQDNVYDNGTAGDSNLTQVTQHVDGNSSDDRVTQNLYDWRDRLIVSKQGVQSSESDGTHRPIFYYTPDNLGEVKQIDRYDGDGVQLSSLGSTSGVPNAPSSTLLRARSSQSYDDQGRVYLSQLWSVDGSGNVGSSLSTNTFYDHRGETIEVSQPGGLVEKHQYDGAGRDIKDSTTDGGVLAGAAQDWTHAGSVTSDVLLEQTLTSYDPFGNPIVITRRQRFDNDPTTSAGDGDLLGPSGGNLASRDYYSADYYDAANRLTDSVDVGTNGGSAWTRPASVPAGSDTVLVTHTDYDPASFVLDTIGPRGVDPTHSIYDRTRYTHDMLGRTTETVAAWDGSGTPTVTANTNQKTDYTYDGEGHILTMKAWLPPGTTPADHQTTAYIYGIGSTGNLFSNDLISKVEFPLASGTGAGDPSAAAADDQSFGYNWEGQKTSFTDQNGTTHTYTYDILGRLKLDSVQVATGNPQHVDQSILSLGYTFDSAGRPYQQTSYSDAAGTVVVNQVQDAYNGYGQLLTEYQAHAGPVITATSPKVQYVYTQGTNYSRLTAMIYPNTRQLDYVYNSGLDSTISRVSGLSDHAGSGQGNLESYSYLGLGTIVRRLRPNSDLTYVKASGESNGDAGDQYNGLDRFGRVVDQRWVTSDTPGGGSGDTLGSVTDRFQYGYDRDSNVLYRNNLVNTSFGEMYHANAASSGDNNAAYDSLGRLTHFQRGTLVASTQNHNNGVLDTVNPLNSTSGVPNTNNWTLDTQGNWNSTGTQSRTFNSKNEIATISGQSSPTYDNNGNMTHDELGNAYAYDAWNRMTSAAGGFHLYAYDAINRRPALTICGSQITDSYYTTDWQVLEEDSRAGGTVQNQYVWGLGYIDDLVLRDDNSITGLNYGTATSGLGRRLYAQQDANWNVTAVTDTTGAVQERMIYDPYGSLTALNPTTWASHTESLSWNYLWQGLRLDSNPQVSLYDGRGRMYRPSLGVWMQQDKGYWDGANLYQVDDSNPVKKVDPTGSRALAPVPPQEPDPLIYDSPLPRILKSVLDPMWEMEKDPSQSTANTAWSALASGVAALEAVPNSVTPPPGRKTLSDVSAIGDSWATPDLTSGNAVTTINQYFPWTHTVSQETLELGWSTTSSVIPGGKPTQINGGLSNADAMNDISADIAGQADAIGKGMLWAFDGQYNPVALADHVIPTAFANGMAQLFGGSCGELIFWPLRKFLYPDLPHPAVEIQKACNMAYKEYWHTFLHGPS